MVNTQRNMMTDTPYLRGEMTSFQWFRETLQGLLLPGCLGVLVMSILHASCPPLFAADGMANTTGRPITATFSIVAVDPATGQCGAAVASKYPAVGKVVPYVRAGVGAFCTQHWHHPPWGEQALDLLQRGKTPVDVLGTLLRDDPDRDQRQLAIIDAKGRTASVNPTGANRAAHYWGAMAGRHYACQGNTLVGRQVIVAMARAYEETDGSLADRLMAALVAGDSAGGDHRGRLAAGIRVANKGTPGYWLELYVDKSDNAVAELAKKYGNRSRVQERQTANEHE
jgi:uncharacterized Ntn-hydrolase superfamily protein